MENEIIYEQIKIEDLSLNLSVFNGPLDLLLHLVKEEKIEIKDIFVSQVTEQFLSYMGQLNTVNIDKASEYMTMAATLLEIKSRALLPEIPELEENESPEKLLIRQLEEYKLFKEVTESLKQKENVDRLFKQPSPEVNDVIYAVKDMSLDNLLDAFASIIHRVELNKIEQNNPKQIKKDSYSVGGKIKYMRQKLIQDRSLDFLEFCDESGDISEVVVAFIALLELLKHQLVTATQNENFDSIIVTINDTFEKDFDYEKKLG
ncbi:MAG TPA: segregation/condensation protein A [Eubacteriales bacterium]|nr:segregation/condensation protein A [Eubacteriales bacterium]